MKLEPAAIVLGAEGAFVLAHPTTRGQVDVDRTLIFAVQSDEAKLLRDFEIEITGIAHVSGAVFAVDADANLHRFANGTWTDWSEVGDGVPRITTLRAVADRVHGLTCEGVVCEWTGTRWKELTPNDDETYLFDLALDGHGRLMATGDNGFVAFVDQGKWSRLEVPTTANLTSLLVLSPDKLLLTGWSATAFLGDGTRWTEIDAGRRTSTFLNAVAWSNRVLVAGDEEILELDGTRLTLFAETPARRLASDGTALWKHAHDGVAWFDGKRWKPVPLRA